MQQNMNRLDVISLKAAFIDAAIWKIGDGLISYSALITDETVLAKIVVYQTITAPEEEGLMDILGDMMGHFPGVTADFQLVKIQDSQLMDDSETLPIKLFRRAY